MNQRFKMLAQDPRIQPLLSLQWKLPFAKRDDRKEIELIEKIERSGLKRSFPLPKGDIGDK